MKIFKKNNIKNLLLNKSYIKYYLKKIILKTFLKSEVNRKSKFLIKLKWSNIFRNYQISRQLNLCKISGTYKKTFNKIGANRHELRKLLNTDKIIHWKKNSW